MGKWVCVLWLIVSQTRLLQVRRDGRRVLNEPNALALGILFLQTSSRLARGWRLRLDLLDIHYWESAVLWQCLVETTRSLRTFRVSSRTVWWITRS